MNAESPGPGPGSSPPPITAPPPAVQADLFGSVAPASATATTNAAGRPAEWPAAPPNRPPRTVAVPLAGDRPPAGPLRPVPDLAGEYARHGQNLRRGDGRSLVVCLSTRPQTGRRPGRYVRTVAPAEPIRYAGSLYADAASGADDLDGCQFQDRQTGTRYAIRRTAPDRYAVQPVRRRRGRARS